MLRTPTSATQGSEPMYVVDGVILITDASTIRRKELRQTIERLRSVHANILGISLNRLDPRSEGYYAPYFEYYSQKPDKGSKDTGIGSNGLGSDVRRRWVRRVAADDEAA